MMFSTYNLQVVKIPWENQQQEANLLGRFNWVNLVGPRQASNQIRSKRKLHIYPSPN